MTKASEQDLAILHGAIAKALTEMVERREEDVTYNEDGEAVSTGIFPNAVRYMTFSGTTMQPQDTDGATANSALFVITLGTHV